MVSDASLAGNDALAQTVADLTTNMLSEYDTTQQRASDARKELEVLSTRTEVIKALLGGLNKASKLLGVK